MTNNKTTTSPDKDDLSSLKTLASISQLKKDMSRTKDAWFVTNKAHVEYLIRAVQPAPERVTVHIKDIKIGTRVKFRDGKTGEVFKICEVVIDGVNFPCDEKIPAKSRLFIKIDNGGERYYTYRSDGISDLDPFADIILIMTEDK